MYNRIIQFNDFKIFRNEKEVVILDIENGKLVKVDERTLKVIQNNNLSKEELFQKSKKYCKRPIRGCIEISGCCM